MREKMGGADGGGSGQQGSGQDGGQREEQSPRQQPPYSMHGVLHFIQHEWSKYEMERSKWEMERAEMQARISFLQGERKGQENLKADLVRRIKMLEYCLKQERAKNYRLTHNGQEPPADETANDEQENSAPDMSNPLDTDAYALDGVTAQSWKQGRQLLKQYLDEIGASETIMDVRSFRMKHLIGIVPHNTWGLNGNADIMRKVKEATGGAVHADDEESDSSSDEKMPADLDPLAANIEQSLGEFDFLNKEQASKEVDWAVNHKHIEQMKEKYRSEKQAKRLSTDSASYDMSKTAEDAVSEALKLAEGGGGGGEAIGGRKPPSEYMDINDALGLPPDESAIDIKDPATDEDDDASPASQWAIRAVLRSHLDVIRAMQFHPVEPVLLTAGEDGTAKLWNLEAKPVNQKESEKAAAKGSSGAPSEMEPVATFRGHQGPVLSMDVSPTGDRFFTGGLDGVVCCWASPSSNCDPYDSYDPKVLRERFRGHSDAVWAVAYHSSDNRLVSASADGTVKMWQPGDFTEPLLRTFNAPSATAIPTSVDFSSTDPQHLLTAYTSQTALIMDIETGQTVLNFDFDEDAAGLSTITKIISHPTMPVTVMSGDDRKIRYFDNRTGKQLYSAVAHVEGISALAIDPNGLYLLSGSHDGSLRLWNMEKRTCLKELPAHRKKYDAAVTCVAIHPSRPLIGSAGADALAKVYSTETRRMGQD